VKTWLLMLMLLFCLPVATAQGRPATAGQIELRKYEATHQIEPPPQAAPPSLNYAQVQREADELSSLAQSIPLALQSVNRGTLPKDLLEKLRKIEKLSKHLRSELNWH
jgi:hypothetical protein